MRSSSFLNQRIDASLDSQRLERAVGAIQSIQWLPDAAAVLERLMELRVLLEVDEVVFVSFLRDDERRESFRFLTTMDPSWCVAYQQVAPFSQDPWLAYATACAEPVEASRIPIRTKTQQAIRDLAFAHGIASAYVVPAPSRDPLLRIGVLVLGSSRQTHFDRVAATPLRLLARGLATELHEWWIRQTAREFAQAHRLRQEEIQLLAFQHQGLSSKQIAKATGTSPASVDSRFQRLNARLGVPNRKVAARLAHAQGLLP